MLPTKYFLHHWYSDQALHSNTIQRTYSSMTFSLEPMRILENLGLLLANNLLTKEIILSFCKNDVFQKGNFLKNISEH